MNDNDHKYDPINDPIDWLWHCTQAEKKYKESWQYEEVIAIFQEEYPYCYLSISEDKKVEIIKSVAVNGITQQLLFEHKNRVHKRAKDIAESSTIKFIEIELEELVHQTMYSEN